MNAEAALEEADARRYRDVPGCAGDVGDVDDPPRPLLLLHLADGRLLQ